MAKESFSNRFKSALTAQMAEVAKKTELTDGSALDALSGRPTPIDVKIALNAGELAYTEFPCQRNAIVDRIEENTVGVTKKKGVVTRAVVGGILTNGIGAIVGAASAGSKTNAKTTQETVSSDETVDKGHLYFTNSRIIFVGQEVVSIDYKNLMSVEFRPTLAGSRMELKYPGMLKGEAFVIPGKDGLNAKKLFEAAKSIQEES